MLQKEEQYLPDTFALSDVAMSWINLIGVASTLGVTCPGCEHAPQLLHESGLISHLQQLNIKAQWHAMLEADTQPNTSIDQALNDLIQKLARIVQVQVEKHNLFVVLGGDHSCAMGTWQGVYNAIHNRGSFGLIWIDAHMDSHTPSTSPSGAYHGMPLAWLLGAMPGAGALPGGKQFLDPAHLSLVGVRAFEAEEAQLLEQLGVRVFSLDEVRSRGMVSVMNEALSRAAQATCGYGVSLDLDAIDPLDAPGVSIQESDGLRSAELLKGLSVLKKADGLLGIEIVEYNPSHDIHRKTSELIFLLLTHMLPRRDEP